MFNEDKTTVPGLPLEAWVSTLLAEESHKANHEGVERTRPAAPFEFTTIDLFGPYEVKDEVKK